MDEIPKETRRDVAGEALEVVWEIEPGARAFETGSLPEPTSFEEPAVFDPSWTPFGGVRSPLRIAGRFRRHFGVASNWRLSA
jgi:hypothetical protein